MNFALLHLARPERALSEARRVLHPGGQFAFTLWAAPQENPGARIVEEAVAAHADRSVSLPEGPDYFLFRDDGQCRRALEAAGFALDAFRREAVRVHWLIPSPEFYFEAERDAGVRTAGLLARQTRETLAAIRDAIVRGVEQYRSGAGYEIPMVAYVVSAGA